MPRPTYKYESWMPAKLKELAHHFFIKEIAVQWGVTQKTMWYWANCDEDKEDFADAYQIANDIILARIFRDAYNNIGNRDYNHRLAEMIINILTNNTDKRNVLLRKLKKSTTEQRIEALLEEMSEGTLRSTEVKDIIESFKTMQEMQHFTDIEKRLAALEGKVN